MIEILQTISCELPALFVRAFPFDINKGKKQQP
jgi:hypothetical protein